MTNPDRAVGYLAQGYNCAQAVLAAFAPGLGLAEEAALRLAAPLGAGIGRSGETCGALLGALLALGLRHGVASPDRESKERIYVLARDLMGRFADRFGSTTCKLLLDCDLSTPEGQAIAREKQFHSTVCPRFARGAAELLDERL